MDYQCSLCGKKVGDDLVVYIDHTERHIIDEIKAHHPDWADTDGVCRKCVAYYKLQMRGKNRSS